MIYLGLSLFLVSASAFAVELPPGTDQLDLSTVLPLILQAMGGLSGAGTMAIALVAVQIFYLLMRSKLGEKTGLWRLTILSALAVILGFAGLLANGVPFTTALFHASMLPLIQNFIAQVVIQLQNHGEDSVAAAIATPVTPDAKSSNEQTR